MFRHQAIPVMSVEDSQLRAKIPPLVRTVLTQAARLAIRGEITRELFEAQLDRLRREELEPRGFDLLIRELPGEHVRFLVKAAKSGTVCDMIDCFPEESVSPM